ncbi:MAG: VanW family protein [Actinomycetes bacterium]
MSSPRRTRTRPAGGTFSLNQVVGERTAANGFTEGTIILDGRFATALGGAVSPVATTTLNAAFSADAAFFAGQPDVEHHRTVVEHPLRGHRYDPAAHIICGPTPTVPSSPVAAPTP